MEETISIYFEKLGGVGGVDYYHETIVYTNASGVKELATAYASKVPTPSISGLSDAASAAKTGSVSDYGVLQTETAPIADLSQAEQIQLARLADEFVPKPSCRFW